MDSGLSWRRSRSVPAAVPDAASDTIAMRKPSRGAAAMVKPPARMADRLDSRFRGNDGALIGMAAQR